MAPARTPAARLIRALQLAYSGEFGAVQAYLGHRRALPQGPDRELITRILKDEIAHRRTIVRMLTELGSTPDPKLERRFLRIGRTIACLCQVGGWYVPMYGAALLESKNIGEYEDAAQLAWLADRKSYVNELLCLGEVEWDHELWLRERCMTRWLWRVSYRWPPPAPRETIRERFAAFVSTQAKA
jgi:hypothetical protein